MYVVMLFPYCYLYLLVEYKHLNNVCNDLFSGHIYLFKHTLNNEDIAYRLSKNIMNMLLINASIYLFLAK